MPMAIASIGNFTYDSANRLTVAGTRYYAYDVEGTRIKTQKGEDTTEFVYNVNARLSQLLIKTENNADMKMQIVSAQVQMPTNKLWNHRPKSGPMSISNRRASKFTITELMSIEVS